MKLCSRTHSHTQHIAYGTDLHIAYMKRDDRDRRAKEIQIRECMAHKSYIYHKHISFAGVRDSGLHLWRCEWCAVVCLSVCVLNEIHETLEWIHTKLYEYECGARKFEFLWESEMLKASRKFPTNYVWGTHKWDDTNFIFFGFFNGFSGIFFYYYYFWYSFL